MEQPRSARLRDGTTVSVELGGELLSIVQDEHEGAVTYALPDAYELLAAITDLLPPRQERADAEAVHRVRPVQA